MSSDYIGRVKTSPPAKLRIPVPGNGKPDDFPHMGRVPGVPDSRYEAFNLPSLISGQRVYPKRTT